MKRRSILWLVALLFGVGALLLGFPGRPPRHRASPPPAPASPPPDSRPAAPLPEWARGRATQAAVASASRPPVAASPTPEPRFFVRGFVVEQTTQEPLEGVAVKLLDMGAANPTSELEPEGATDAEGRFELGPVPPGPKIVRAEREEPNSRVDRPLWLVHDQNGLKLELGTGAIEGRLLQADGAPVPQKPVQLLAGELGPGTETDAQGRFVFGGLPGGVYGIQASVNTAWGVRELERFVELAPGGRASVTLRPAGGLTLSGMVQCDPESLPAGVYLELEGMAHIRLRRLGGYRLENLPAGRYRLKLSPLRGRSNLTLFDEVVTLEDRDVRKDILMPPLRTLRGKVVDERGAPVPEAAIRTLDGRAWGGTFGDGRFEAEMMPAGRYRMFAQSSELVSKILDIEIPERGPVPGVEFVLALGGSLQGRILTPSGRFPPGARLFLLREHGSWGGEGGSSFKIQPDATGAFELRGLPPLAFGCMLIAPGYAPSTQAGPFQIQAGRPASAEFRLGAGGGLKLTVIGLDGQRRMGQRVELERLAPDGEPYRDLSRISLWGSSMAEQATDGLGVLRLERLEPGRYRVRPWRRVAPEGEVEVREGEVAELTLRLQAEMD